MYACVVTKTVKTHWFHIVQQYTINIQRSQTQTGSLTKRQIPFLCRHASVCPRMRSDRGERTLARIDRIVQITKPLRSRDYNKCIDSADGGNENILIGRKWSFGNYKAVLQMKICSGWN